MYILTNLTQKKLNAFFKLTVKFLSERAIEITKMKWWNTDIEKRYKLLTIAI